MKRNIGVLFITIVFFTIAIVAIGLIIDEARYAWGGSGVGVRVSTTVTKAQPVVVVPSTNAPAISPTDSEGFSSPTNVPAGAPDTELKKLLEINDAQQQAPTSMPGGKPTK